MASGHNSGAAATSVPIGSRLPTLSTQATGLRVDVRKLVFTTEYHFLESGIAQAKTLLLEALEQKGIPCPPLIWDTKQSLFKLTCHQDSALVISYEFHNILRSIIRQEGGEEVDEEDFDESSEDDSVDSSKPNGDDEEDDGGDDDNSAKSQKILPLSRMKALAVRDEVQLEEALNKYPPSIAKYAFKTTWAHSSLRLFEVVTSEYTLQEIGHLTASHVVRHLTQAIVYIGSDHRSNIGAASAKLDTISKYAEMTTPQAHAFYSEATEPFKIAVRPLIDCKKRMFETTLFDNSDRFQNCYEIIGCVYVCRMTVLDTKKSIYFPFKEDKYYAVTPAEKKSIPLRYWENFTYEAHGSVDPLKRIQSAPSPSGDSRILTVEKSHSAIVIDDGDKTVVATSETKVAGWVKALPEVSEAAEQAEQPPRNVMPPAVWDTYVPLPENTQVIIERVERFPFQNNQLIHTAPRASTARNETSDQYVASTASAVSMTEKPQSADTTANGFLSSTSPMVIDVSVSSEPQDLLDGLSPLMLKYPSLMGTHGRDDDSLASADFHQILKPPPPQPIHEDESLIQLEEDGPLYESQQSLYEPATRKYHSTMLQKAPRKSASTLSKAGPALSRLPLPEPLRPVMMLSTPIVTDPLPGFLSQVKASVKASLEVARGFSGSVTFRVSFGRILVGNIAEKLIEKKDTDLSHFADFLSNILSCSPAYSLFTRVLTSVPEDVQYMIDLEETGQRMWSKEPDSWEVIYCFHYEIAHSGQKFSVNMHADSLHCEIKQPQDLGSTYIHGIRRHWDLMVEVSGTSKQSGEHDELLAAIKDTLCVPEQMTEPSLTFTVNKSLEQKYSLSALQVRRVCNFNHREKKAILNVQEVQELDFSSLTVGDNEVYTNRSSMKSPPSETLGSWFEVAVSCPLIDQSLKINETLPLGEEAPWQPEEIAELVESACLPAYKMLKRIDGVGFYNNNDIEVTKFIPVPEPKPPVVFW